MEQTFALILPTGARVCTLSGSSCHFRNRRKWTVKSIESGKANESGKYEYGLGIKVNPM